MADNVVEGRFVQKQEIVYECVVCGGGQTFWLDFEGTITCKACKAKQLPPRAWAEQVLEHLKAQEEE